MAVFDIKDRSYVFSKNIIEFIQHQKFERIYFSLFDQLLRSATSIGANLVEGSAGSSKKDFINFFYIALKSANESKYWLNLIKETLQPNYPLEALIQETEEISKIIATIIIKTKSS